MSNFDTLPQFVDKLISLTGWVDKIKKFKKHTFIILRSGGHKVQIIIDGSCDDITLETYLSVTGIVKELPKDKYSFTPYEIQCQSDESSCAPYKILSPSNSAFSSLCPDDAGTDIKLNQRHIYLRNDTFTNLTLARSLFLQALRQHFDQSKCVEIIPPCFVPNQCEGGATLFKVDHVGQPAYLTQSSQFYLEYAVPAVGDCYCIYPSFRAEKSHTRRHLTEFLHAEAEWSGILTIDQYLDKLRDLLVGTIKNFLELDKDKGVLTRLGKKDRVESLLRMDIITLTHAEAIEYCRTHNIYKDDTTQTHFDLRDDIPESQERKMIDQIGKIVFLVKFPREFKSFYMASDPLDPSYVLGCDVEVPGVGEIIGSGIRVSDADELRTRIQEQGLNEDEYKEYIDLRLYGHGKTSGMGLGVDRMLTWILDLYSIRDIVTYPRYPDHLIP